jgi:hypothetical protein
MFLKRGVVAPETSTQLPGGCSTPDGSGLPGKLDGQLPAEFWERKMIVE